MPSRGACGGCQLPSGTLEAIKGIEEAVAGFPPTEPPIQSLASRQLPSASDAFQSALKLQKSSPMTRSRLLHGLLLAAVLAVAAVGGAAAELSGSGANGMLQARWPAGRRQLLHEAYIWRRPACIPIFPPCAASARRTAGSRPRHALRLAATALLTASPPCPCAPAAAAGAAPGRRHGGAGGGVSGARKDLRPPPPLHQPPRQCALPWPQGGVGRRPQHLLYALQYGLELCISNTASSDC